MDPAHHPTHRSRPDSTAPIILPFPGVESLATTEAPQAPGRSPTFLEELELRQDEVLAQLDELDRRVVALIEACVQAREPSAA
jgi:hypothetical protein